MTSSSRSQTVESILEVLYDPTFVNLRTCSDKHPLTWNEFCAMKMPYGLTCEQTWEILNAIRRQTAIELPFRDADNQRGWFSLTRSITDGFEDIEKRCSAGSQLDTVSESRNMVFFAIESYVSDALACLREDGIESEYENVRAILLGERAPEEPEELLVFNGHQLTKSIDRYVDKPCSVEVLSELYSSMVEGIDVKIKAAPVHSDGFAWRIKRLDSISTLELVSSLVNATRSEDIEHPLILALGMQFVMRSNVPFPAWNSMATTLIMKLIFKKANLPVLAFLPINKIMSDWKQGWLRNNVGIPDITECEVKIGDEIDYTLYVDTALRLVRRELDDVEERFKRILKENESFVEAMRDDLDINYRQRDVLRIALDDPKTVFKISDQQKRYLVAYGTARSDLLKLAELGLLVCIRKGHAFEFHVAPGLRQLIMTRESIPSER